MDHLVVYKKFGGSLLCAIGFIRLDFLKPLNRSSIMSIQKSFHFGSESSTYVLGSHIINTSGSAKEKLFFILTTS